MYNKAKYLTSKIGAILSIILGSLILLFGIIFAISLMSTCGAITGAVGGEWVFLSFLAVVFRFTVGTIFLGFGIQTARKPFLYTYGEKNNIKKEWVYSSKGKDITLVVFSGILFFAGILASDVSLGSVAIVVIDKAQWILNILALGVLICKIITLCIKGDIEEEDLNKQATSNNAKLSAQNIEKKEDVEGKIKELQRFRNLGIITEEQYKSSIEKIIKKAAE